LIKGKGRWYRVLSFVLGLLLVTGGLGQLTLAPAYAAGMDVLYEGTVSLSAGDTFKVTVSGTDYTVDVATPLGLSRRRQRPVVSPMKLPTRILAPRVLSCWIM